MTRNAVGKAKAWLVLEDGTVYAGASLGAAGIAEGEIVFHTAFCGYQEILTDPSYRRQIVTMAFPVMGNYGVSPEFAESMNVQAAGMVVCDTPSATSGNEPSLHDYLREQGIPAIADIDTRALIRRVRSKGAMRAVIGNDGTPVETLREKMEQIRPMSGADLVTDLPGKAGTFNDSGWPKIGILDCGSKEGLVRALVRRGCRVERIAHNATATQILDSKVKGLLISNGPGDPAVLDNIVSEVRQLIGEIPIFGICLGHQILAQAADCSTYKLPFGHHGANHPVLEHQTGKIRITSQNHGFAVDTESLPFGVKVTETNLYDETNEGIEIPHRSAFSVQYHPEGRPGPLDAAGHFDRFVEMVNDAERSL